MLKTVQRFLRRVLLLFVLSSVGAVVLYRWVPVYVTPLMLIRAYQQIGRGEKVRLKHHWVSLDEGMSLYMPIAVMAAEDQLFLTHRGFDFKQIGIAVEEFGKGKRQRGASTITQQTAKNVFLWPAHSWVRKGLEVYLNSIEMGDGIYGAEAVAQQHFSRPAIDLSRANCALIAATLPNPLKLSSKEPSAYVLRRQSWIMGQMRHIDIFPKKIIIFCQIRHLNEFFFISLPRKLAF